MADAAMVETPSMDGYLPLPDKLVMTRLLAETVDAKSSGGESDSNSTASGSDRDSGYESHEFSPSLGARKNSKSKSDQQQWQPDEEIVQSSVCKDDTTTIRYLHALNKADSSIFDPTVFVFWDTRHLNFPKIFDELIFQPYVRWASTIVRHPTDVVMITHLLLYFTTSVPSALYLYYNFTYLHGIVHSIMQVWYAGTYTLMMHQHIHQNGILKPRFSWFDKTFPYLLDPLHGHTWNTYYLHHVKHHHVEGNGPDDLSSTIRYQRDNVWHFLHYVGRFYFFIWLDLPIYFWRKRHFKLLTLGFFSEYGSYLFIYSMAKFVDFKASLFVLIIPVMIMRFGLMTGNWGQHAFVDDEDPDSDFRSSITLLDVSSNRFCYNDGYHTSHHLNPRRHWRDHPVAFLEARQRYENEHALVFTNIDYLMLTIRLLMHDYETIARCMIPLGEQKGLTLEQRVELLKRKTRRFSEEEIRRKFKKGV